MEDKIKDIIQDLELRISECREQEWNCAQFSDYINAYNYQKEANILIDIANKLFDITQEL
jgi:hypothetical protein